MSGLQNFLAPFSHLLFANRNLDIVVLCFVLFGVSIYALTNRWRADRLERDLANSRSNSSTMPAGRRYAAAQPVEEPVSQSGALPAVKGGRSYARNLGSALQKAGMSGPQIYSPPTPAGFAPNATPMPGAAQPGMGQPPMGQPYAPASAPWPPAPPTPAPWAFPGGAGRNAPNPPPPPAPFYSPPPGAAPTPTNPFAPVPASAPGGPGHFPSPTPPMGQPGQPSGPFAPPFGAPTSGPAPMPPVFAPPGAAPMTPPAAPSGSGGPAFPAPPMMQPPSEPEPADASRRGKPKRRRFNFNVLENLEKMVQAKPAEPAPQTGWTPPPAPVPPAAAATGTPASTPAPLPALTPSPESATLTPKPIESAPTLPFLFGGAKAAEPAKETTPAPAAPPSAHLTRTVDEDTVGQEPAAAESDTAAPSTEAVEPTESAPEPVAQESSDAGRSSRRSMRSMMFGEELSRAEATAEPEATPVYEAESSSSPDVTAAAPEAEQPAESQSESSWPSYPWEHRQDAEATEASEQPVSEGGQAAAADEQPAIDSDAWKSSDSDAWKPSEETAAAASTFESDWNSASEAQPEVAAAEPEAAEAAQTAQADLVAASEGDSTTIDASEGGKPSAGTLVIIEDDQTAASYYSTLFSGNGYHVEVANDGVSGVDLCARVQPQVILLDVMMPRQNGILVLQTLRASDETKNTPVVVMSNFSEPTLIKRALQLGALEYVIKTQVEGPALLNALPRWMNREKAFAAA